MREPLPIFTKTSAAWAEATARGADPVRAAEDEWKSKWQFDQEDRDPSNELVLGGVVALEELLRVEPAAGEDSAGWALEETTRLGRCARRLWDDLLGREVMSSR
jgi:exonuclease V gamma subunit